MLENDGEENLLRNPCPFGRPGGFPTVLLGFPAGHEAMGREAAAEGFAIRRFVDRHDGILPDWGYSPSPSPNA